MSICVVKHTPKLHILESAGLLGISYKIISLFIFIHILAFCHYIISVSSGFRNNVDSKWNALNRGTSNSYNIYQFSLYNCRRPKIDNLPFIDNPFLIVEAIAPFEAGRCTKFEMPISIGKRTKRARDVFLSPQGQR